ncbi:molybdopterin molybdotransferase MoeA [Temperatibacter marinus]|uniref:Molybdopterin molybdenumtransferase n=1 Tax=Temperatibacter marinus TaxID=1456591 RepID=A0AA52EFG5_9PROT|nr:molybdopterin molybdotransferase MoeA [Temperatibacter marinus]WND01564.1 molybdopterin molybdotransferase MoeA [Temperatibacter marinus]
MQDHSMVSLQQALDTIGEQVRQTEIIDVTVENSLGYVLAENVVSLINIPPFDNSAMDGFALKSSDVTEQRRPLKVLGIIAAGDVPLMRPFNSGECYQIMTGAPIPAGCDTVVPVELSQMVEASVTFSEAYPAGKHIRQEGTDIKEGARLYAAGRKITSQMIQALCSVGQSTVKVYTKPSVVWLSTGEELTDTPGDLLEPGKIFNSSGPYGEAVLPALGAALKWRKTIPDDLDLFRSYLDKADEQSIDVIISTGAVSVGVYDFVRSELEAKGWDILLHRAKVKPGKPILFAKYTKTGSQTRYFFGLPGNPVSSAMGLRVFVTPFLRAMQNLPEECASHAVLTAPAKANKGLTVFMKAVVKISHEGRMEIQPLEGQLSYQTGAMGDMNAWLIHPEGKDLIDEGAVVTYLPFLPD